RAAWVWGRAREVQSAVAPRRLLAEEGIAARVVSMPCREWFEEQDSEYRDEVIPPQVRARVAVEAGVALGWRDIVGDAGRIVSLEHFGASAAYSELFERFGITATAAVEAARQSSEAARTPAGVSVFARPTGPVLPDTSH